MNLQWNWRPFLLLRSPQLLMYKTAKVPKSTFQQKIIAWQEIQHHRTNSNKYYKVYLSSKKSNKVMQMPIRSKKYNLSILLTQSPLLLSKLIITPNLTSSACLETRYPEHLDIVKTHQLKIELEKRWKLLPLLQLHQGLLMKMQLTINLKIKH